MQEHLRDYVWMALPGGNAESVPATTEEIGRKMAAGYSQVFPGIDMTPVGPHADSQPASTEEEQQ